MLTGADILKVDLMKILTSTLAMIQFISKSCYKI